MQPNFLSEAAQIWLEKSKLMETMTQLANHLVRKRPENAIEGAIEYLLQFLPAVAQVSEVEILPRTMPTLALVYELRVRFKVALSVREEKVEIVDAEACDRLKSPELRGQVCARMMEVADAKNLLGAQAIDQARAEILEGFPWMRAPLFDFQLEPEDAVDAQPPLLQFGFEVLRSGTARIVVFLPRSENTEQWTALHAAVAHEAARSGLPAEQGVAVCATGVFEGAKSFYESVKGVDLQGAAIYLDLNAPDVLTEDEAYTHDARKPLKPEALEEALYKLIVERKTIAFVKDAFAPRHSASWHRLAAKLLDKKAEPKWICGSGEPAGPGQPEPAGKPLAALSAARLAELEGADLCAMHFDSLRSFREAVVAERGRRREVFASIPARLADAQIARALAALADVDCRAILPLGKMHLALDLRPRGAR